MKHSRLGKAPRQKANPEVAPTRRFFSLFKGVASIKYSRVFLSVLVVATVFSFVTSPFASAAPQDDAQKILRAGWVAECIGPIFRGTDRTQNRIEDIQAYKGVAIADPISGHIISNKTGRGSCTNDSSQTLKNNINTLGYSDILDLMKSLGCTQNSGATSYSCPELSDRQVYSRIAADKNIPAISDAMKYYIAFNTFAIGCKATVTTATQGSADWEAAQAKKNNLYLIPVVGDDGSMPSSVYRAELDGGRKISTANASTGWGDGQFTCDTLANMARTYASAYSTLVINNRNSGGEENLGVGGTVAGSEGTTSCAVEGIGWILCPVINALAGLADGAFKTISENFLQTSPSIVSTQSDTYKAWVIVRNIANVAFVIAFLFIIFSQLTSVGITNYGIKKMLPRLAIAAILVNASFLICQLAVDLSNILGFSINEVLGGISGNVANSTGSPSGFFATGNTFSNIAVGVLAFGAGAVVIYAMLSVLGPVLIAAALALAMILFILIARQALIVILVVVAPLAFVAFLLPNTEKLFKQWRKMFTALLLVFPMISLIFGGSQLASTVVSTAFTSESAKTIVNENTVSDSADDLEGTRGTTSEWLGQIIGAAIIVLPLFAVPSLLKKSLDGIPVVGQMASRWGNRANSKIGSRLKDSYRGSLIGRGAAIRKQGRENYRTRRFAERISQDGVLGTINQGLAKGIGVTKTGRAGQDQLMKRATAETVRARAEEAEDAKKLISNENLSGSQRQELAMNGKVTLANGKTYSGESMQRAAIEMQLDGAGSYGDIKSIISASAKGGALSSFSPIISQGALKAGSKDPTFSGKRIDDIAQGTFNYEDGLLATIRDGKLTSEALAGMHNSAREEAIKIASNADAALVAKGQQPQYMQALQSAAMGLENSTELRAKIAGNTDAHRDIVKILGREMVASGSTAPDQNNATQPQVVQEPVSRESVSQRARQRADDAARGTAGTEPLIAGSDGSITIPHSDTPPTPPTPPAGS